MLCQKCGLNAATVHRESVVFRQRVEEHLCELCAGTGAVILPARFGGARSAPLDVVKVCATMRVPRRRRRKAGEGRGDVRLPVPHGLAALPWAVTRLLASQELSPALHIFLTREEAPIFASLRRGSNGFVLGIVLGPKQPLEREAQVQAFFSARGINPVKRTGLEETASLVRALAFGLGSLATADLAALLQQLLSSCFGVAETDTLELRFHRA